MSEKKKPSMIRIRAKVMASKIVEHGVGLINPVPAVIQAKRTVETAVGKTVTYDLLFPDGRVEQGWKFEELEYVKRQPKVDKQESVPVVTE